MNENKEENKLFQNNKGDLDIESLLAQWQTCVEMANSVSARRDTINNLFVTLHLALITTIAVIWDTKAYPILGLGGILCVLWFISIGNYRKLNQAKYDVICEIEKHLPAQPFNVEWGYVKKRKFYIEGTQIEKWVPIMFLIVYFIIFVHIFRRCSHDNLQSIYKPFLDLWRCL